MPLNRGEAWGDIPNGVGYHHGTPTISWVICGAESGPKAREMKEDWVRNVRDQCADTGTAFLYKQKVANGKKISLPELDGKVHFNFPEPRA